jgi:hypothetical protein
LRCKKLRTLKKCVVFDECNKAEEKRKERRALAGAVYRETDAFRSKP